MPFINQPIVDIYGPYNSYMNQIGQGLGAAAGGFMAGRAKQNKYQQLAQKLGLNEQEAAEFQVDPKGVLDRRAKERPVQVGEAQAGILDRTVPLQPKTFRTPTAGQIREESPLHYTQPTGDTERPYGQEAPFGKDARTGRPMTPENLEQLLSANATVPQSWAGKSVRPGELSDLLSAGVSMYGKGQQQGPQDTNNIREYEYAVRSGFKGTFDDWLQKSKAAGASKTNLTVGQSEYGAIPQGYALRRDEGGDLSMYPIEGGPVSKAEAAKAATKGRTSDVVTEEIDRTLSVIKSATLPTTGMAGTALSKFSGLTDASRVARTLETIRGNIGFDQLQKMRETSPTGGALGPVSDFENRLLQSVLGSLEQSNNQEDLVYNLNRLKRLYQKVIHEGIRPDEDEGGATGGVLRYNPQTGAFE